MRLIKLYLEGFGRFTQRTKIDLDHKTIALIGPNEAGKSQILRAIAHLNHDRPITNEVTWGYTSNPEKPLIKGVFALDARAIEWAKQNRGTGDVQRVIVKKYADGRREFELPEFMKRVGSEIVLKAIRELVEYVPKLPENFRSELIPILEDAFNGSLEEARQWSSNPDRNLDDEQVKNLIRLSRRLLELIPYKADRPPRNYFPRETYRYERVLTAYFAQPFLNSMERERIKQHYEWLTKGFVPFTLADREIPDRFRLMDIPPADGYGGKPAWLTNFVVSVRYSFESVQRAVREGDLTKAEDELTRINDVLRSLFYQEKGFPGVYPTLTLEGDYLQIDVVDKSGNKAPLSSRSDGFRWYLSLLFFLHKFRQNSERHLIPLIDEIETHLDYEAQAQIIQLLTQQQLTDQVIYTTHSPGCLPEDLTAVRAIERDVNTGSSTVKDKVWEVRGGQPMDYRTFFFLMGAQNFAFTAARAALITEGEADFALYPRLFRDILEKDELGFQVLCGLSGLKEKRQLEGEALRVVYLTDGDMAGRKLKSALTREGVHDSHIFQLEPDHAIEDYLLPDLYLKAVNAVIWESHGDAFKLKSLSSFSRPIGKAVEDWYKNTTNKELKKSLVAQRVRELAHGKIFDPTKESYLRALAEQILSKLCL